MPQILSKLLSNQISLPYNCYEVGHTWTPICSKAAFEVGYDVFTQSLKMYATLYLASQLVAKKYDPKSFKKTLLKILRSSAFLGTNASTSFYFMCLNRRLTGKFYFLLCSHLPAFLSSLLSICIEAKSRRQNLALYVLNIASETVFRSLVDKEYVRAIPNGEVLLFAAGVSILFYLSENKNGQRSDFVSKSLRFLVDEHSTYLESEIPKTFVQSCLNLILKPFAIGFGVKYVLSTFSSPPKLLKQPSLAIHNLTSKDNLKFALFLTSFKCFFKITRKMLQSFTGKRERWHSFVSGFTAAFSMLIYPHSSMSLYLLWKSIENLYMEAVNNRFIKHNDLIISILYAIATSQLFFCAVHEPKSMKKSYMKFLNRVTNQKMGLINRNLLDVFGTGSSYGFESDIPKLSFEHTSRQYKETVFLWLIN